VMKSISAKVIAFRPVDRRPHLLGHDQVEHEEGEGHQRGQPRRHDGGPVPAGRAHDEPVRFVLRGGIADADAWELEGRAWFPLSSRGRCGFTVPSTADTRDNVSSSRMPGDLPCSPSGPERDRRSLPRLGEDAGCKTVVNVYRRSPPRRYP
jgi:hypothetical protein